MSRMPLQGVPRRGVRSRSARGVLTFPLGYHDTPQASDVSKRKAKVPVSSSDDAEVVASCARS
eukprot:7358620-Lingulodinium_polyedra.AAC.1